MCASGRNRWCHFGPILIKDWQVSPETFYCISYCPNISSGFQMEILKMSISLDLTVTKLSSCSISSCCARYCVLVFYSTLCKYRTYRTSTYLRNWSNVQLSWSTSQLNFLTYLHPRIPLSYDASIQVSYIYRTPLILQNDHLDNNVSILLWFNTDQIEVSKNIKLEAQPEIICRRSKGVEVQCALISKEKG